MKRSLLFSSLLLAVVACNSPESSYRNHPASHEASYREPADYDDSDSPRSYGHANSGHGQSHQQVEEDHTLRNAALVAGIGYLAGRAHANYKNRQTQNTTFHEREDTRYRSSARPRKSSGRRTMFGSMGSRSRRRR
jgi:hypothetical protein